MRIGLVVAILASITTTTLSLTKLRQEIAQTRSVLKQTNEARDKAETALASAEASKKTLSLTLQKTEQALQAKTAEAVEQTKRARQFAEDVTRVTKERDNAQAELAGYRTVITVEDALNVTREFKKLNQELAAVQQENTILARRFHRLQVQHPGEEKLTELPLPANLTCKVVVYDPKWNFIVIDAGEDQGMLERAELLVSRNGSLIGKARAVRVEKNRCIANLIPGWQLGDVREGDVLIPAYPES